MFDPTAVPTIDPNPLPAPYWVFKLLLIVTFFLHITAMNCMLGGAGLALFARWRGRTSAYGSRIFLDIAKKVPTLLAATITLGIAPLLFVQVLYGQYIYTSSIVMAWPWFLVILLLMFAYYGFYFVAHKGEKKPAAAGKVMLFSIALCLIIGFIYSNNFTLSQTPATWAQKYLANPTGWNLNLAEPTLIPRYLHFMVSAVAVGGLLLVMVAWANWKRDEEYAKAIFHLGGKAFLYATMAQYLVGSWFLMSLPREMRLLFMGDNPLATALFGFGFLGAGVAIMLMSRAVRTANIRLAGITVTGLTAAIILSMSVMRETLRDAYLKPWHHPQEMAVSTQWSPMIGFLVLFVAGIVLWFIMLMRYGFFKREA